MKRESYTQMCVMYFPPGYEPTQKGIYTDYWDGITSRISSVRLAELKTKSEKYYPIMDSILNYCTRNEATVLMACCNLYAQLNPKLFVKKATEILSHGGDNFLATAILEAIEKKDIEYFKKSILGKYFFNEKGEYRYPEGAVMDLVHIPNNPVNRNAVLSVANKFLETH